MKKNCVLGILLLMASVGILSAQVSQAWLVRYTNLGNTDDRGLAITVDASGNTYVTGEGCVSMKMREIPRCGDSSVTTIKYDPSGNQVWIAQYHGPATGVNVGKAITLDGDGNVYVTGHSEGGMRIQVDYITLKYDNDGNELWSKRYNGPASSFDRASAIALDGDGYVYVTGQSWGEGSNYDYATIKYDPSTGDELWVRRYNGPANADDSATAMGIDASNNIYVTGYSARADFVLDYATIKYDSAGNQLWIDRYNATTTGRDSATAMALDADGNIYVTGDSSNSAGTQGYATIKYDPDGNRQWISRYEFLTGRRNSSANALAIDPNGFVYVTGKSHSPDRDFDFATVKYDAATGDQIWVARYDGPATSHDTAFAIALDANGNVYVTGEDTGNGTRLDYATVKYDSNGNQIWVMRYDGPGHNDDSALAIVVDSNNNVHITGTSIGNGTGQDYATIMYTQ